MDFKTLLKQSIIEEANKAKPSAGLSKKEKSDVVKKAKAGKDIGKKGKGFEKLADKAAEKYGSKEKGQKVAAAAMWKNIKRENAEGEVDQEGQMAKVELKKIAEYAVKIYGMLQDDTQLDAWVQDHIAKAAELMDQVGHFMNDQNDDTLIQPVAEKKLSKDEKAKIQELSPQTKSSAYNKADSRFHTAMDKNDPLEKQKRLGQSNKFAKTFDPGTELKIKNIIGRLDYDIELIKNNDIVLLKVEKDNKQIAYIDVTKDKYKIRDGSEYDSSMGRKLMTAIKYLQDRELAESLNKAKKSAE